MPPIILKLKGNESFLPFSDLDQEELSKTWRVCTKVKDSLENGSRLENLSWRLWFIQNVLVSNDVKASFSRKTRDLEKELEPSLTQLTTVQEKSVLDYSLDEIKPVASTTTENFILNQFTSDQENDQMIELKDIFPFGMQDEVDFMYNTTDTVSDNQLHNQWNYNNTVLQQQQQQQQQCYNSDMQSTNNAIIFNSMNPNSGISPYVTANNTSIPSMTIPFDDQLHQNSMIDFNTNAYVSAAAALTAIPNATLHNKLLATLPRETLQSAERLLSPIKRPNHQQPLQNCIPDTTPPVMKAKSKPKQQQQHYFSTFQLDPNNNTLAAAKQRKKYNQNISFSASSSSSSSATDEKPPICSNCEATTTPLWRRSVDDKVLCNACGLYLKLHNVPRPKHMKLPLNKCNNDNIEDDGDEDAETKDVQPQTICSNCGTIKTPLWRRDHEGAPLCNACGLYLKLHNQKRPLSMKTDVIKKRQRTETLVNTSDSDLEHDSKKPRYYDQHSLYSSNKEQGTKAGYRNSATSLPGTGILMMTPNIKSHKSSST